MAEPDLTDPHPLMAQATALLGSDRLTAPTRAALAARLSWRRDEPRAISATHLRVLDALARLVVPLGALDDMVDLAGRLDADLARGTGDGWRYAVMPRHTEALCIGLGRCEADGFLTMGADARHRYVEQVRLGAEHWPIPSALWFEDVFAHLVQLAYGHPLVQLSIGYDGMADADGFLADA